MNRDVEIPQVFLVWNCIDTGDPICRNRRRQQIFNYRHQGPLRLRHQALRLLDNALWQGHRALIEAGPGD